jgi:hypothetical protein
VQAEDQFRVAGPERAGELRAVADVPGSGEQRPADAELASFPRGQRRRDVTVAGGQLFGQGPGVVRGLGGAGCRVRAHRERRVTDQAGAAERHPRHPEVVDHLHERLGHAGHDVGDRRGEHVGGRPPHARHGAVGRRAGRQRHSAPDPVPAGHQVVELRPGRHVDVPDDVDQPVAGQQRPVQRRDRVDEDVAAVQHLIGDRVVERPAGGGRGVALRQRAAPGHVARVLRDHAGDQPGPGGRADPVRAHQQVSTGSRPVGERDADPVVVLAERDHLAAEQVAAGVEERQQRAVDRVPGREPVPVPLFVLDAAVAAQEADPAGRRAHVPGTETAALGQVAQRGVERGDPGPARPQRRRGALENADVAAGVAQNQRRGQPAERASDNDDAGHPR